MARHETDEEATLRNLAKPVDTTRHQQSDVKSEPIRTAPQEAARMPNTETERETWADWLPDAPAVFTRAEMTSLVNASLNSPLKTGELEQWEREGVLPTPAGDRGYPEAARQVILELIWELQKGSSRREIREELRSIAAALNAQVKKETWWDWLPDESLEDTLTLEELLEAVNRNLEPPGITSRRLRSWQEGQVLPLPIRRWHNGATRALYPKRAVSVIQQLIDLQSRDYPLRQIRERLRGAAALQAYPDPHELQNMVTKLARRHQEVTERPVHQVEIRFIGTAGKEESYVYVV